MTNNRSGGWILAFAAIAAILALYLVPLGSYRLMEPDEGRYSEIPREMIETGDYVTPKLNYIKYFEKPVLLYWMNAGSFQVFGQNEFAARFPTAVAALAGALVTGLLGSALFGRRAGVISGVVTATSLLYFAIGRINITDMPMSFFLTLAMASFYAGHRGGNKKWYLMFYAAMALGVLTKGLIGVVLPAGIIFWYIVFTRKWRLFVEALYVPGIILFFAISAPWFYKVCQANGDFFHFFFIQEHFLRYATKMHGRYQPFWFFLPLIPAELLPWTGFLFSLFGRGSVVRSPEDAAAKDANIFLLLWFGVILLFFSLSSSKLIPYIVPCIPPLAILIGADIDRMAERGRLHGGALWWTMSIAVLFSAALIGYSLFGGRLPQSSVLPVAVIASAGLLIAPFGLLKLIKSTEKGPIVNMSVVLCVSALVFLLGLQKLYPIIAESRSTYEVSQVIIKERQKDDTIAVYGEVLQGVPFYTRSRVMLIDYFGELEFGGKQAEGKGWFPTGREFLEEWKKRPFILVVEDRRVKSIFPDGPGEGVQMIRSGEFCVFINREAVKTQ